LPASNDPEFGAWLPIVFDILQAIGLVGNVVLILTFLLAKDVRRHVTWLGFCCAWVFSSTAYLILSVDFPAGLGHSVLTDTLSSVPSQAGKRAPFPLMDCV
jgi:hypothetical protein